MSLIFKIAWRNLLRHKGKSLVIGLILFLGAFIMTLGNAVISGMDKGITENIVNRFTGHLVLVSTNQEFDNVLFSHTGKNLEVISGFTDIKKVLDKQTAIKQYLPTVKGMAMALSEDAEPGFTLLFGVKFEDYNRMFDHNVQIVEGREMKNDERGCMITTESRNELYSYTSHWLLPDSAPLVVSNLSPEAKSNIKSLILKSNIIIMGFGDDNSALDIRVPIKGIYKYKQLNKIWHAINFIDIESFRESFNYVTGEDASVTVPEDKQKLLSLDDKNLDSLFSGDVTTGVETKQEGYDAQTLKLYTKKKKLKQNIDAGAYNLILVKLKNGDRVNETVKDLNKVLKKARVDARAITWRKAASEVASIATIIRGSLYGFVLLIFFVAIIIIMNTLSMAAIERTTEIGMMRAVGATKDFIARMFIVETAILAFLFGGAGGLTGIVLVKVVSSLHLTTANEFLQLLYGGDIFQPQLSVFDIVSGIFQLALVTVFAVVYPLLIAVRITPLEAIARD